MTGEGPYGAVYSVSSLPVDLQMKRSSICLSLRPIEGTSGESRYSQQPDM